MSHPVGCTWLGSVPPTLASFTVLQRAGTLVGVKVASGVLSASRMETCRDVRGQPYCKQNWTVRVHHIVYPLPL